MLLRRHFSQSVAWDSHASKLLHVSAASSRDRRLKFHIWALHSLGVDQFILLDEVAGALQAVQALSTHMEFDAFRCLNARKLVDGQDLAFDIDLLEEANATFTRLRVIVGDFAAIRVDDGHSEARSIRGDRDTTRESELLEVKDGPDELVVEQAVVVQLVREPTVRLDRELALDRPDQLGLQAENARLLQNLDYEPADLVLADF